MLIPIQRRCDGSALIVALLILIVMTILGISTVTTSTQELMMAGNTQDMSSSFQSAEAGITGTMSLAGGGNSDPFDAKSHTDDSSDSSFGTLYETGEKKSAHPLKNVPDVSVLTDFLVETDCPAREKGDSSDIKCEIYRVDSTHASSNTGAYSKISQGVMLQLPP